MDAFCFTRNGTCRRIDLLARRIGQRRDATPAPMQVRNGWRPHRRLLGHSPLLYLRTAGFFPTNQDHLQRAEQFQEIKARLNKKLNSLPGGIAFSFSPPAIQWAEYSTVQPLQRAEQRWSFAPQLSQPIFSAGRLRSTVRLAESGKTHRLFGTVQDITELKRAEEARHALSRDLEDSRAWLEEAQRVVHVGYWVWDLDSNRVIWLEETCRIFGLSPKPGSMDIAAVREMFHPDDREAVFRTAEEAIRSGTRAECEHRLIRPDGEVRVVHSLGDVRKDSEGRAQLFGTTQDITERKLAEQALRRSQFYLSEGERLAHMGSWASRDLGVRWSDDLDIYWSDEVYKIFGFDPKDGPPNLQRFSNTIHPQDRPALAEAIKRMHEQHCSCDVTNRVVRPDGLIRYVRVGIPVIEDGGFRVPRHHYGRRRAGVADARTAKRTGIPQRCT